MANGGDQQQQMQYQQGPPQQVVVQQKKDRGCLTAWWVSLLPDNPFYPIPGSVGRRMRLAEATVHFRCSTALTQLEGMTLSAEIGS